MRGEGAVTKFMTKESRDELTSLILAVVAPDCFDLLCRILRDTTHREVGNRMRCCQAIGLSGHPDSFSFLLAFSKRRGRFDKICAAFGLSFINTDEAAEALLALAGSSRFASIRHHVLRDLSSIAIRSPSLRRKRADLVVQALKSRSIVLKVAALDAARKLKLKRSRPQVQKLLIGVGEGFFSWYIPEVAGEVLASFDEPAENSVELAGDERKSVGKEQRLALARQILRVAEADCFDLLCRLLRETPAPELGTRLNCCEAIGGCGHSDSFAFLVSLCKSRRVNNRLVGMHGLVFTRSDEAAKVLLAMARSSGPASVRATALFDLSLIYIRSASLRRARSDAVLEGLKSRSTELRTMAVLAAKWLKLKRARPQLKKLLNDHRKGVFDDPISQVAAETLALLEEKRG